MKHLYDFGISQDDPQVEAGFLDLENKNLLCIASGGEVPLSLLANHDVCIKALDKSANQIRLCRLKMAAALHLEPYEAAVFLGYKKDLKNCRGKYFNKLIQGLPADDAEFRKEHKKSLSAGPVKVSRFEKYLSFFSRFVTVILGKKKLEKLFDLDPEEARKNYFDNCLDKKVMFSIFKIAFSPRLYKKRGLDQQGLIHQAGNDLACIFYGKFRDFLTATPPVSNLYLQFYLMGEILFDEALPDFLNPTGQQNLRKRKNNLRFEIKSLQEEIMEADGLFYENYALSNISDWVSVEEMNYLLNTISWKSKSDFKMLIRYIHKNPVNDGVRDSGIRFDVLSAENAGGLDRFPFYSHIRAEKS